MPSIKLYYDGWLVLPAALRKTLGLATGDRLDVALVDGAIVLRRSDRAARTAKRENEATVDPAPTPARRGPGRARKADRDAAAVSAPKRPRGRPRTAPLPEPSPSAHAAANLGPAKLVKKAEVPVKPAVQEEIMPHAAPVRRIRPDGGFQAVERRPFRNVEIRPLGPGRGHNKHRAPTRFAGPSSK